MFVLTVQQLLMGVWAQGDGWSDRSSFDVLPGRVSAEAGPLADRLPSGPAAMELAAGHTLAVGQAAAQLVSFLAVLHLAA